MTAIGGAQPERDLRVLAAIHRLITEHGYSPSYREIQAEAAVATVPDVMRSIERLAKGGLVTNRPGQARTVRVTVDGEDRLLGAAG